MGADILAALAAPFPPEDVQWRVGTLSKDKSKGMALAYIDARAVMRRLDEVVGADWQDTYDVQYGLVICKIGIKIDNDWRWRQDGTTTARDTNLDSLSGGDLAKAEQQREMDSKGSLSDAFKRAAVKWGIGRYLYDIDSPWVAINQYKQIEPTETARLRGLLGKPQRGGAPAPSRAPAEPISVKRRSAEAIEADLRSSGTLKDLEARFRTSWPDIKAMAPAAKDRLVAVKNEVKDLLALPPKPNGHVERAHDYEIPF